MKCNHFAQTACNLFLVTSLIGCATITRGATEQFIVETSPSEAIVRFSTGETCITPCVINKKRKEDFTLIIVKEGYKTTEFKVKSELCPEGASAMAGDAMMIGGVICLGIDYLSGATLNLMPNPVNVTLEKDNLS
jgi:hypothetical protein